MGEMGRKPLPPEEKRESITIRLNKKELEQLDAYCERKGWTRAEAVRRFIDLVS